MGFDSFLEHNKTRFSSVKPTLCISTPHWPSCKNIPGDPEPGHISHPCVAFYGPFDQSQLKSSWSIPIGQSMTMTSWCGGGRVFYPGPDSSGDRWGGGRGEEEEEEGEERMRGGRRGGGRGGEGVGGGGGGGREAGVECLLFYSCMSVITCHTECFLS